MNILVHGQVVQPAPLSSATVDLVVHPDSTPVPEPGYFTTKETSDDDKTLNPVAVTSSEETSYQS